MGTTKRAKISAVDQLEFIANYMAINYKDQQLVSLAEVAAHTDAIVLIKDGPLPMGFFNVFHSPKERPSMVTSDHLDMLHGQTRPLLIDPRVFINLAVNAKNDQFKLEIENRELKRDTPNELYRGMVKIMLCLMIIGQLVNLGVNAPLAVVFTGLLYIGLLVASQQHSLYN